MEEFEGEDIDAEMESNEVDNPDDDTDENAPIIGPCVSDMWINGWDSIDKMNIKETRELQRERLDRKKKVQAVILQRVQQIRK